MSDTYQDSIEDAAHRLVEDARRLGVSIGCAESCTGGLVCGAITGIPGSSAIFRGGVVSYDPAVKHDVLGVTQEVIDDPAIGVVSDACAVQMCAGAARVLDVRVCVSVTGIAGPGGAEPGKPVGTVWFGLWVDGSARTAVRCFAGSREDVRAQAVIAALGLLCEGVEECAGISKKDTLPAHL